MKYLCLICAETLMEQMSEAETMKGSQTCCPTEA